MTTPETFVIVGAGQAGGRAAEAMRAAGFAGHVVLIGEEPSLPYERPPLSKAVLTGDKPASTVELLPPGFYAQKGIEVMTGTRVEAIDAAARTARLSSGRTLGFTKLLLTTGGRVRTLPFALPGMPGIFYLRTLAESLALGAALKEAKRVAVIGGGFLGLEVAASARKLGLAVTLLELKPHLLDRAMAPEIAHFIAEIHRRKGVELHLGANVTGIAGKEKLAAVELAQGTRVDADLAVVAVGIAPNSELAAAAGAAIGNGIVVDEFGRTSLPDIYAAGDVADHPNPILGHRLRLESWQNAQNQAIATARAMCGVATPYAEVPWFWSDQYEFNIQMVGAPLKTDEIVVRGEPASGRFLCFNLASKVVVGATAFNMGGEIRFARKLVELKAKVEPGVLSDGTKKLRDVVATLSSSSC
ncbi:MAG: NAD(P)/FAD-dependent oxidoreductase [Alphaproteobacteria bacterium]